MTRVSVIIPCYNQGHFIDEAVDSVLGQTFENLEIIIVNDGSTDDYTNSILAHYKRNKTEVINTVNKGPSHARNTGINRARGEYILPLDADDKIHKKYIEEAVSVLDQKDHIGIVYSLASFFGDRTGPWLLPPFTLTRFLNRNLIFCSGVYRRSDWEHVHGYDEKMSIGLEDWDFWLSLIELNRGVYQIPRTRFFYRIHEKTRTSHINPFVEQQLKNQLMANHKELYQQNANAGLDANDFFYAARLWKMRIWIIYFLEKFVSRGHFVLS